MRFGNSSTAAPQHKYFPFLTLHFSFRIFHFGFASNLQPFFIHSFPSFHHSTTPFFHHSIPPLFPLFRRLSPFP
jgi:hypothetical protein